MRGNKSKPKQPAEQFVESIEMCIWRKFNAKHSKMCSGCTDVCVFAYKRDKSTCDWHGVSSCDCPQKLFQATKNSKRALHLYTFWDELLGSDFPITDNMVKNVTSVISHRDAQGRKDEGCCINGRHYVWSSDRALEAALVDGLRCLQDELPGLQELLDDKTMTLNERISRLSLEFRLSEIATPEQLKKEPICRNRFPKAKGEKRSAQEVTPCRRSRTRRQDEDSDDEDYSPSGRLRVGRDTEAYTSPHQLRAAVRSLSPRLAPEDSSRKKTNISDSSRLSRRTIKADKVTNPLSQYKPLSTPPLSEYQPLSTPPLSQYQPLSTPPLSQYQPLSTPPLSQYQPLSTPSQSSQSTSEVTRQSSELSSSADDFYFPVGSSISIETVLSRELSFVPISTEAHPTKTHDFARNASPSFLFADWPSTDDQFDWAFSSTSAISSDGHLNFELPLLNFS